MKHFDSAEESYLMLKESATAADRLSMVFEAELGLAKLAIDRGNVPDAEHKSKEDRMKKSLRGLVDPELPPHRWQPLKAVEPSG